MDYYDPDVAPDPEAWLALDEAMRLVLVEDYHREARIKMPRRARRLHAVFHTVVENQLAMADQPIVRETLERLMHEGLSRHDAVHAVGSVLAGHVFNVVKAGEAASSDHAAYYDALKELTVDKWRSG